MQINTAYFKYRKLSEPIKAALWYTIANILLKGIALLSTPIFTRILTEEEYGTFSIFQSWYSILIIFTSLNMFLSGYTKGLIKFKNDRDGFTSSLLSLTIFITIIFFLIYLLNTKLWTKFFELPHALMLAMFIELITMPAIEFWSAKQRFDYKYKKYLFVSISSTILSISLGIISVLIANNKLEVRVFSDVFAKGIFGVALILIIILKGKKIINIRYWKYALLFNIPLLPHYLSNFILSQSDRVMISKIVGNREAAFYSIAYTISTMMNLIITAINNSLVPYIYKAIDKNNIYEINKATAPLILLVAFLSVITMMFAPEIIIVFAGPKYIDAIYIIPPVAASVFFIFLYSLFSTIEYYYQKTRNISIATLICALLNIILNLLFIKLFGYYAAGYTTLICYIVLAILHYIFYKKIAVQKFRKNNNIYSEKIIWISSIGVLIIMIVMTLTYKSIIIRYSLMLFVTIILILYSKQLRSRNNNIIK